MLLAFLVILVLIFFFFRSISFYALLFFLSFELQHFLYTRELKINPGHIFFISFILARENISIAMMFLFLCGFMAELIAGYVEAKTLLAYPIYAVFAFISYLLRDYNVYLIGVALILICYFCLYLAASAVAEPLPEKIFEVFIPAFMGIIYLSSLSRLLELLIHSVT